VSISISIPLSLLNDIDSLEGKTRSKKMRTALTAGYEVLTNPSPLKTLKEIDGKLQELEEASRR
jgi:hypothetical protein